jgi:DNA repair exonuclease SbcCD ATPase subunit
MQITLKNFRCYENSTFDFGKSGIILLSGASGQGKTTILMGIHFALFGTGTKIITFGKTTCSVTLLFDDMTITRTKKPNRLVLNDIYEDESAQNIINKRFGNTFNTVGYICQNAQDSFIMMSPIEKLGFIEKFAFQDIDICQMMKRCKDLIKERHETLIKTTAQFETASNMIEQLKQPDKVLFPIKCSKKNKDIAISNEIVKCKNTNTFLHKNKKKLDILQTELTSLEILNALVQSKEEGLNLVIKKLLTLSIQKDNICYEGDEKLLEYEEQLLLIILQRDLAILKNRYNEDVNRLQLMKEEELNNKCKKMLEITKIIWVKYTEDECKNIINENKQIIKDLEKLNELNAKLDSFKINEEELILNKFNLAKYNTDIESKKKLLEKLKIQKEVFKCPSCFTHLKLQNNNLCIYNLEIDENSKLEDTKDEIFILQKKISSLESCILNQTNKLDQYKQIEKLILNIKEQYEALPVCDEIKHDLEYIKNYMTSQQELNKEFNTLKNEKNNKKYSFTVMSFEKQIVQQDQHIKEIELTNKQVNNNFTEELLRCNIITQKQNKENLELIKNNINTLKKEKCNYEKQITDYKNNHITKYSRLIDVCNIKDELNIVMLEKKNLELKKITHEKNVQDIEKYQVYKKDKNTYDVWVNKLNLLKTEEFECRKLYAASTLLKEKILEAESIAMINIISSINTHATVYLEYFFPDNPISVKLVTFKETKKGKTIKKKPQINLEIEYKGMEADINMLSGGELSRIILAFSLALGEMFNTPIMLLDECTSSLDQELTTVVMDGIRENFSGNIVIIIAHQCITGMFDKVIKI